MYALFCYRSYNYHTSFCSGESGLVYKAYINTAIGRELVAVKTGKGKILESGTQQKVPHIKLSRLIFYLCSSLLNK